MATYTLQVPDNRLYTTYLTIMNGILQLTPKEIEVFSEIMYKPDLSLEGRKYLQSRLNLTQFNLNNYLVLLKKKGVLKDLDGQLIINPKLIPTKVDNKVKVEFELSVV